MLRFLVTTTLVLLLAVGWLTMHESASADPQIVASIDVPFNSDIAVNNVTRKAYVATAQHGSVYVIDTPTLAVSIIPTGDSPDFVVVDEDDNKVYVGDFSAPVKIIDGSSGTVVGTMATGAFQLAIDPVLDYLYVSHAPGHTMSIWDANSQTQVANIDVGGFPAGFAVDVESHLVYVSVHGADRTRKLDGTTGQILASYFDNRPWDIGFNPVTDELYVLVDEGLGLTIRDTQTGATQFIQHDFYQAGNGDGINFDPVRNRVYVSGYQLAVIDGYSYEIVYEYPPPALYPVAVDTTTGRVFALDGLNKVYVIDDPSFASPTQTPAAVGGLVDVPRGEDSNSLNPAVVVLAIAVAISVIPSMALLARRRFR